MAAFCLRNFPGISKAKIVVLWDMIECPIPQGLDPVAVSENIRKALKEEGYHGCPFISAFTDTYEPLEMFFEARIAPTHLPDGDRDARRRQIVSSLLCQAVVTPSPANFLLIVGDMISKHSSFHRALILLNMKKYNCMVAHPEFSSVQYNKSVSSKWLWDSLAKGEKSLDSLNSSQCASSSESR